jgi:hypothetical protein
MKMNIEENDTQKAVRGFAKLLAIVIILLGTLFGDVMYISRMQDKFPTGLLLIFCYLGGIMGFLCMCYLLMGKCSVFAPGGQMLASWVVLGIEMLITSLNILIAFTSHPTGFLDVWDQVEAMTPVLFLLGTIIVFFLDPELKEKHRDKEMQSKIRASERAYQLAVEEARLQIKQKHLEFTIRELQGAINSPESQARISQHAVSMNDHLLTEMSGQNSQKSDDDDDGNAFYSRRIGRR